MPRAGRHAPEGSVTRGAWEGTGPGMERDDVYAKHTPEPGAGLTGKMR